MVLHPFEADPDSDPTFHFGADPDPDPDPTPNFTHVGKSDLLKLCCKAVPVYSTYIVLSFSLAS